MRLPLSGVRRHRHHGPQHGLHGHCAGRDRRVLRRLALRGVQRRQRRRSLSPLPVQLRWLQACLSAQWLPCAVRGRARQSRLFRLFVAGAVAPGVCTSPLRVRNLAPARPPPTRVERRKGVLRRAALVYSWCHHCAYLSCVHSLTSCVFRRFRRYHARRRRRFAGGGLPKVDPLRFHL